jgi:hypothetical protein
VLNQALLVRNRNHEHQQKRHDARYCRDGKHDVPDEVDRGRYALGMEQLFPFHIIPPPLEQRGIGVKPPDYEVGRHNRRKPDNGLEQACGYGHTEFGRALHSAEYESIQHLRDREKRTAPHRHVVEQAEIGIENPPDRKQTKYDDDRPEHRDCYVHDLLALANAVNHRGLVVFLVYAA